MLIRKGGIRLNTPRESGGVAPKAGGLSAAARRDGPLSAGLGLLHADRQTTVDNRGARSVERLEGGPSGGEGEAESVLAITMK